MDKVHSKIFYFLYQSAAYKARKQLGITLWVAVVIIFGGLAVRAQDPSYALRYNLDLLDTTSNIFCYDVEIQNTSDVEWTFQSSNIFVFYDASFAIHIRDSLRHYLNLNVYSDISLMNDRVFLLEESPFAYDSIGYMRPSIEGTSGSDFVLPVSDTWNPFFRLCFQSSVDNLPAEDICFQADFYQPILMDIGFVPVQDVVTIQDNTLRRARRDTAFNLIPDNTFNSCFILTEDSDRLCSDGVDNDEDGLMDCEEESCGPRMPVIDVLGPGGCDNRISEVRILESGSGMEYSLDGDNFQRDSIFRDLAIGGYTLYIRRMGLTSCQQQFDFGIDTVPCLEQTDRFCADGIDNDNDGLTDCMDDGCYTTVEGIDVSNPASCPDLNDGRVAIVVDQPEDAWQLSVDGGSTYEDDLLADNLVTASYTLRVRNAVTGCELPLDTTVQLSTTVLCFETGLCNDGIDNDNDGAVDCNDTDCIADTFCQLLTQFEFPNVIAPRGAEEVNRRFGVLTDANLAIPIVELSIYDRYGGLVYRAENTISSDESHFWDGTYQSQAVPMGVYTYRVQLQNENTPILTGTVTVLY